MTRSALGILPILLLTCLSQAVEAGPPLVLVFRVEGEIMSATEILADEALHEAEALNASLAVMLLDTPGGSLPSVRRVARIIEASPVPAAVFVYPAGAVAWSGGAYVLMVAHIAVMASGTSVGSAQPVTLTPLGPAPVNESKLTNALAEFIEQQAVLHSRNSTVARLFVTQNLNLGLARP